ncbi:uncharacterized protein MYCFIDRAFT_179713 [Pseudocercospora fijiensis CIRAD86]|uniref:Uncharacterized protein n=1 Tax=Pseudocercospora fijiensis (strain CIRAD86) TaxID=383855 RepID=M2ZED5_PSEFD|nr:uncharacterized protein MYCFIDRAFT_179713 [Pseudocercospora fijiensis CIRAD86]EME77494.1 hypothetical protein MYCFIDRAFT_179713 [Pseudocercospora fijiensis CIRAD86]
MQQRLGGHICAHIIPNSPMRQQLLKLVLPRFRQTCISKTSTILLDGRTHRDWLEYEAPMPTSKTLSCPRSLQYVLMAILTNATSGVGKAGCRHSTTLSTRAYARSQRRLRRAAFPKRLWTPALHRLLMRSSELFSTSVRRDEDHLGSQSGVRLANVAGNWGGGDNLHTTWPGPQHPDRDEVSAFSTPPRMPTSGEIDAHNQSASTSWRRAAASNLQPVSASRVPHFPLSSGFIDTTAISETINYGACIPLLVAEHPPVSTRCQMPLKEEQHPKKSGRSRFADDREEKKQQKVRYGREATASAISALCCLFMFSFMLVMPCPHAGNVSMLLIFLRCSYSHAVHVFECLRALYVGMLLMFSCFECLHAAHVFMLRMSLCLECLYAWNVFMLGMSSCFECLHASNVFMLRVSSCFSCVCAGRVFILLVRSCYSCLQALSVPCFSSLPPAQKPAILRADILVLFSYQVRDGDGLLQIITSGLPNLEALFISGFISGQTELLEGLGRLPRLTSGCVCSMTALARRLAYVEEEHAHSWTVAVLPA